MASKCKCRFNNLENAAYATVVWMYPFPDEPDTEFLASGINLARAQPYCKMQMIGIEEGGNDIKSIEEYMTGKKLLGNKEYLYDPAYSANITAQPANLFSWIMGGSNQVGHAGTAGFATDVELTYYVKFYDRYQVLDGS